MPRFSLVVPTRDRPDLLEFCLAGIAAQTFTDVEVIVCDNPIDRPARVVFERWAKPGWRYVRPSQPLAMHDNFELGCEQACGDYVAVVTDPFILHPSALEVADRALASEEGVDIVSWRRELYRPIDEANGVGHGLFGPTSVLSRPALYDPRVELRKRFANEERRGVDEIHFVRGKIVFGAYSRRLVGRIRERSGRLFHPLAPDYTSMVPACVFAEKAVDVGRSLVVAYVSARSNGIRQMLIPGHARRFIETADPSIIDALPIAGLYTSLHNVIAYDLVSSAARCPDGTTPLLDFPNLLRRAREDLASVSWTDAEERAEQYSILEAAETREGVTPLQEDGRQTQPWSARRVASRLLAGQPTVRRLVYRSTGRAYKTKVEYASPVDAARAADRFHSARLS